MNYFEEVFEIVKTIGIKFSKAVSPEDKIIYNEMLKEIHKQIEPLEKQYKEERQYLTLMKKESSAKLNRILAKVIVLRDDFRNKVDNHKETPVKKEIDIFLSFCKERVRERKDGYPEVTGEKVTIKELLKCYKRWSDVNNHKKLDPKVFEANCETAFGDSKGKKVYEHIRVFLEEEDVEEFDRLHHENTVN